MRPRRATLGFTLVELLVVIAIIGILAGFIAAGLPRVIEKAKVTSTVNNMRQIQTILTTYLTDRNTFPPAYGFLSTAFLKDPTYADPSDRPNAIVNSGLGEDIVFFLLPWMSQVREHGNQKLYDNWSNGNGYDTDGDKALSQLEYAPIGIYNGGNQTYTFGYTVLYRGPSSPGDASELARQMDDKGPRPFIYVPVNSRQARQFRQIIYDFAGRPAGGGNKSNPRPFNLDPAAITAIQTQLSFPPPSYDAFVLISVGPAFNSGTNGIIVDYDKMGLGSFDPVYAGVNQYHLLALATYFMATRDAEGEGKGDGELDFDYRTRSSQGDNADNDMPGMNPKGYGPLIFVGGA